MVYAFYFIAGFLNSFRAVSVFMVLDDRPIIRLIFQKGQAVIENFNICSFQFELMQVLKDSCIYRMRNGDFGMPVFFYGDADSRFDYRSNVGFVHFIWDKFERFSIRKLAITILPSDDAPTPPRLKLYLPTPGCCILNITEQPAMAGGRIENCDEWIVRNHLSLQALGGCRQPEDDCSCII